jgi:alcohol dehydrogenase/L-iditol 2-dehydrogenase
MAARSGANPLIAVGLPTDIERLNTARELGATHTAVVESAQAPDEIMAHGDGQGIDVVIDAAGVSSTLRLALEIVRPAGHITKVGWGPQPYGYSLDPLVAKNVTLRGSFSHTWQIWETILAMLATGQITVDPILSRVAALEDWRDSFEDMHAGRIVKAVLTPDRSG